MNNERFAVPELLFHPSDIGKESKQNLLVRLNGPIPSISDFVGVLSNDNGTLLACRNPRNGNPRGN